MLGPYIKSDFKMSLLSLIEFAIGCFHRICNKETDGSEMWLCGKSVCSCCDGSPDRSFMMDPLSYFLFQPVLVCAILSEG